MRLLGGGGGAVTQEDHVKIMNERRPALKAVTGQQQELSKRSRSLGSSRWQGWAGTASVDQAPHCCTCIVSAALAACSRNCEPPHPPSHALLPCLAVVSQQHCVITPDTMSVVAWCRRSTWCSSHMRDMGRHSWMQRLGALPFLPSMRICHSDAAQSSLAGHICFTLLSKHSPAAPTHPRTHPPINASTHPQLTSSSSVP